MKITTLLLISLLLSVGSFGQSPARTVKGRLMRSTALPKVEIKFGKEFKFVGSHQFVLFDRANVEQFFFVETDDKRVRKLVMVQFEGLLKGVEGTYNYNEPLLIKLGKRSYFSNSEFIPNVDLAVKAVPGSDIARASEFLANKGLKLMPSLVFQRFVDVFDNEKRNEIIILYIEEASTEAAKNGLEARALKSFKVTK